MTTTTDEARFVRLVHLMAEAVMETPDEELLAQPGAAEDAAKTRALVNRAVIKARHDRGGWMDWQADQGWVRDGATYEVEMMDGTRLIAIGECYGEEEAWLLEGEDGIEDRDIRRARLVPA